MIYFYVNYKFGNFIQKIKVLKINKNNANKEIMIGEKFGKFT